MTRKPQKDYMLEQRGQRIVSLEASLANYLRAEVWNCACRIHLLTILQVDARTASGTGTNSMIDFARLMASSSPPAPSAVGPAAEQVSNDIIARNALL